MINLFNRIFIIIINFMQYINIHFLQKTELE